MKKVLQIAVVLVVLFNYSFAQTINDAFFTHVGYVGAFDEANDWTSGWANWDPVNATYPEATTTEGNGVFTREGGLHYTTNQNWSGVLKLDGWVYVDSGAVLTIQAGTIIRGTSKSCLIIERGGKIMAEGTASQPIVFTSNQAAGLRAQSDWAGLALCGFGINNLPGGQGIAEGGIDSPYGGTNNNDNSGVLKYVRIEFSGFEIATGKEINGLTFNSIGAGTMVEYIQVSYAGDDAYEWFGGEVNAKYLISYKNEDDDFDTDNGYCGRIQFAVVLRHNDIADTDACNGFESDNDAGSTSNQPYTSCMFSNISFFGVAQSATEPATFNGQHDNGNAMRLRKATHLQVYNSLFFGYKNGLKLEGSKTWNAASTDSLKIYNCIIGGIRGLKITGDQNNTEVKTWFMAASRHNDTVNVYAGEYVQNPYLYTAPDFRLKAGVAALNASNWITSSVNSNISSSNVKIYPNPVTNQASISFPNNFEKYTFQLFDISGSKVLVINNINTSTFSFDKGNLVNGVYFYKLTEQNNKESFTGKLIIQ